jgi:hypothetical protein
MVSVQVVTAFFDRGMTDPIFLGATRRIRTDDLLIAK